MKKACLFFLGLILAFGAEAQSKIGIKLSPTLSTTRVNYEGNDYNISSDGVGGRFVFGPIYDHFITDNYSFSTGLLYAPKRVALTGRNNGTSQAFSESYNLQYLQLPATLKLFTNELALDTRVFFQLGSLFEVKINEKASNKINPIIQRFKFFDLGIHLGAGVEHRLGYNTIIFGGFFYNRGLISSESKTIELADELRLNHDLLGLDLGVKF